MAGRDDVVGNQFLQGLAVQGRVIGALILRETRTRFWKNRLGYLWAIVEPVLHIATWFMIMTIVTINPQMDRSRNLLFLVTGLLPYFAFRNVAQFMETAIVANQALLNFPIVRHFDLILARFLLESATMIIVTVIIVGGLVALKLSDLPDDMPGTSIGFAFSLMLGFGFGMFNAVFTHLSLIYKKVLDMSSRIFYYCSGVMVSIESLPGDLRDILIWNPIAHAVELFREFYFPLHQSSFASASYVFNWALGLALVGFVSARLAGERLSRPP